MSTRVTSAPVVVAFEGEAVRTTDALLVTAFEGESVRATGTMLVVAFMPAVVVPDTRVYIAAMMG